MGAQQIRQPPGGEVRRVSAQDVGVDVLGSQRAREGQHVVVGGQTDDHRSLGATHGARRDAGVLQRLVGDLEQQSLLRVDGGGLTRRDREELRVELVGLPAGQEPALAVADRARHGVIVGVERLGIPALRRHTDDAAAALLEQVPVLVGIVHPAREPTAHPHHGDRCGARLLGDLQPR